MQRGQDPYQAGVTVQSPGTETLDVTEQDLIEAILSAQDAPGTPTGAMTARELVERTGRSMLYIRRWLRAQARAGRLGVTRVIRTRIDGVPTYVPAYFMIKKEGGS